MTVTSHSRWPAAAAVALAALTAATPAWSLDATRAEVRRFIADLVQEDGFDAHYLDTVFATVESKQSILDAISRPAEKVRPWHEYRKIFLTPARISGGVDFYRQHEARLKRVSAATGVPPEILVAILGVETFYGTRTGGYRVVDSLSTLAFDYPPRSEFFRKELRHLFLLAREEQLDVYALTGSYAGAVGPPQFIPSSYRHFAVDGSGDGRRNLLADWDDIVASVANYFVEHGWQGGQAIATPGLPGRSGGRPERANELALRDTVGSLARQGIRFTTDLSDTAPAMLITLDGSEGAEYWVGFQNFYAITRYNRSVMYALAVYQLGEAIAAGMAGPDVAAAPAATRAAPSVSHTGPVVSGRSAP